MHLSVKSFFTLVVILTATSAWADCGDCYDDAKACTTAALDNCEGACGGRGAVSDRCLKDGKITKDVWAKYRHYACGSCGSYPNLCNQIETCVKYCSLAAHMARECYINGYTSLDMCKSLYNDCEQTAQQKDCHDKCNTYPSPVCQNFDFCYGGPCGPSGQAAYDAPGCLAAGAITLAQCRKYSGQCGDPNARSLRSPHPEAHPVKK